jgi:hypothetical protein
MEPFDNSQQVIIKNPLPYMKKKFFEQYFKSYEKMYQVKEVVVINNSYEIPESIVIIFQNTKSAQLFREQLSGRYFDDRVN